MSYTGTTGGAVAVSAVITDGRWEVRDTIPLLGVAVPVMDSFDVNELVAPGATITVTLVGGGNATLHGYRIAREVLQQWCAARNRPIP